VVELAQVFRVYGPHYLNKYGDKLLPSHRQALRDIERCRTPALGGHVYVCEACGETQYLYHSCRNRHCPKCQNDKAQQWLEKQQTLLLPVPYFLLTFTLPSGLRDVARSHQRLVYDLLFRTSAAAVQHLARDPRFVGGQMGLVGVLHTWGRKLAYHPHVHLLTPAVGLATDGRTWLPASKTFLFPVRALSRIFRAKFRDALRQTDLFATIPTEVWKQEWVVHCQPVGSGLPAVKYLAPYIFRVAISNNRILKVDDGKVIFRYRTSDTSQTKLCTLDAAEFIRRFLQHVLPKHFVKVRYYGFLSSSRRRRLLTLRQQLDHTPADQSLPLDDADTDIQTAEHQAAIPRPNYIVHCPSCGQIMQKRQIIHPTSRSPP
jgi:hypothetical protein